MSNTTIQVTQENNKEVVDLALSYDMVDSLKETFQQLSNVLDLIQRERRIEVAPYPLRVALRWQYYGGTQERLWGVRGTCLERLGLGDSYLVRVKHFRVGEEFECRLDDVLMVATYQYGRWHVMFKAFNKWVAPGIAEVGTRYLDKSKDVNFLVPDLLIFGKVIENLGLFKSKDFRGIDL
ncbi:MAG: hypothetical protein ACPL5F_09645 [Moorellaceae bacterium]